MTKAATDFRVRGLVQGVGFRPTVYRARARARAFRAPSGTMPKGSSCILRGDPERLAKFPETLIAGKPPLARIDAVEPSPAEVKGFEGFSISATPSGGHVTTAVTADACVCDACLDDIFNPKDRRWRYPFANCTHCGPRFTITRHLPYDRPQTVMAAFPMCEDCRAEYEDPLNRRFHAQPIACPVCRPAIDARCPRRHAAFGRPDSRNGQASRPAKSSRSRGSAAFILRATPKTRRRSRRCAKESSATKSPSRS